MTKKYATISGESGYIEKEISYEDSWKETKGLTKYAKRSKADSKSDGLFGFFLDIVFGVIEILFG